MRALLPATGLVSGTAHSAPGVFVLGSVRTQQGPPADDGADRLPFYSTKAGGPGTAAAACPYGQRLHNGNCFAGPAAAAAAWDPRHPPRRRHTRPRLCRARCADAAVVPVCRRARRTDQLVLGHLSHLAGDCSECPTEAHARRARGLGPFLGFRFRCPRISGQGRSARSGAGGGARWTRKSTMAGVRCEGARPLTIYTEGARAGCATLTRLPRGHRSFCTGWASLATRTAPRTLHAKASSDYLKARMRSTPMSAATTTRTTVADGPLVRKRVPADAAAPAATPVSLAYAFCYKPYIHTTGAIMRLPRAPRAYGAAEDDLAALHPSPSRRAQSRRARETAT